MAVKPVDRIRTMITDLERGARTLGDDIRKRASNVNVTPDLESALRQIMHGLSTIAAQLEKAAGELRRFLEAGTKGKKARKAPARRVAAKAAGKAAPKKKASSKAAAGSKTAAAGKTTTRKLASKKAPARKAKR